MNSPAVNLCATRIIADNEEGYRADVYDDATGKPIQCVGEPTVGYGFRVRQVSKWLAQQILLLQMQELEAPLLLKDWYNSCDDVRRSALLEIAFNQGDAGLENGYPSLISAVRAKDWLSAQANTTVREAALQPRYQRIGTMLLTGVPA